jgi:nitrile hydratase accessory protein
LNLRETSPGAPFEEPWQAAAFALAVSLNEQGVFTWSEWAEALASELHGADARSDGSDYYDHWVAALEKLLVARNLTTRDEVARLSAAWERAAHATPHGQPILLGNDPSHSS